MQALAKHMPCERGARQLTDTHETAKHAWKIGPGNAVADANRLQCMDSLQAAGQPAGACALKAVNRCWCAPLKPTFATMLLIFTMTTLHTAAGIDKCLISACLSSCFTREHHMG